MILWRGFLKLPTSVDARISSITAAEANMICAGKEWVSAIVTMQKNAPRCEKYKVESGLGFPKA